MERQSKKPDKDRVWTFVQKKHERTCRFCGSKFMSTSTKAVCCGKPECKKEHKIRGNARCYRMYKERKQMQQN